MSTAQPNDIETLLITWYQRLRVARAIHYESAKPLSRANWYLGIPAAILSAIVGTSVFASIGTTVDTEYKIIIGLVSLLAAVLASLQTFLRFEERAEKHRSVASDCASLIREIEQELAFSHTGHEITVDVVKSIRTSYDEITKKSPSASSEMYEKAKKIVEEQDRAEKRSSAKTTLVK